MSEFFCVGEHYHDVLLSTSRPWLSRWNMNQFDIFWSVLPETNMIKINLLPVFKSGFSESDLLLAFSLITNVSFNEIWVFLEQNPEIVSLQLLMAAAFRLLSVWPRFDPAVLLFPFVQMYGRWEACREEKLLENRNSDLLVVFFPPTDGLCFHHLQMLFKNQLVSSSCFIRSALYLVFGDFPWYSWEVMWSFVSLSTKSATPTTFQWDVEREHQLRWRSSTWFGFKEWYWSPLSPDQASTDPLIHRNICISDPFKSNSMLCECAAGIV